MNIVIDAMSIKTSKLWDHSSLKFIGYPDYGNIDYGNVSLSVLKTENVLTTEALVFHTVSLWKFPIAYFFQNK